MGREAAGAFGEYFLPNRHRFVQIAEPMVMNQRLIAQVGTFLVPGTLEEPIEGILGRGAVVKFVFAKKVRGEAMRLLYTMNITQASLFPDLDGLARSLAYELEFHWAYDPRTMETMPGF